MEMDERVLFKMSQNAPNHHYQQQVQPSQYRIYDIFAVIFISPLKEANRFSIEDTIPGVELLPFIRYLIPLSADPATTID